MKKTAAILLTLVTCGIGYVLCVRQPNESGPHQNQPSSASPPASVNIADPSLSASESLINATTAPPSAEPYPPRAGTLEDGLKTPWTKIQVALSTDDGCTGLHREHELLITRKGDAMTISGTECVAHNSFANIPERPLAKDEFEAIVKRLEEFYQIAASETDLAEHFGSLPSAERAKQLGAYESEHGVRYGGLGGVYFYVQFDTDKPDTIVKNAFEDPKTVESYVDWMRVWWHTCWATLDQ